MDNEELIRDIHFLGRGYYLWVTDKEFYLHNGKDRKDLEPLEYFLDWTCSPDTDAGDLCLLYRTSPKKDFKYMIYVLKKPETDDFRGKETNLCESISIYKFKNPITYEDIGNDPILRNWKPYKRRFQGSFFEMLPGDWIQFNLIAFKKDPEYKQWFLDNLDKLKSEEFLWLK